MFKKSLFLFVLIVFLSVGCVAASDSISANSTTDVDTDFLSADINESDSIEYIGEDMVSDDNSPSHTPFPIRQMIFLRNQTIQGNPHSFR